MTFLIMVLVYMLGFLLGKKNTNDEMLRYHKQLVKSEIKIAKINMIIRSYRNQLLKEETKNIALSNCAKPINVFNYIKLKAKLELIRKIEEDIKNEM